MDTRQQNYTSTSPNVQIRTHLATGVAGVAVIILCGGYVLWSLTFTQDSPTSSSDGITLKPSDTKKSHPSLTTPPSEPLTVSLTLDDRVDAMPVPVVNADHEEPAFEEWENDFSVSTSTIHPLAHESQTTGDKELPEGAWLSGTIERIEEVGTKIAPQIAPFIR